MTRAASPFHAGGQAIQNLAGIRDRIELEGRAVIRDYVPEQHRAFFAALPFMVVGLADQSGHPWATIPSGPDHAFPHSFDFVSYSPHLGAEGQDSKIPQ